MVVSSKIRGLAFGLMLPLIVACSLVISASATQGSDSSATKTSSTAKKSQVRHASSTSNRKRASTSAKRARYSSRKKKSSRVRGQAKIDPDRAQEIQAALIREHYLNGEPTGVWNQASEAAMRKYQADNGWQSKTVPDSRALIKLGLGPSKDHLLNPDSAMTTIPDPPRAEPMPTTSTSAPTTSDPPKPATPSPTPASSGEPGSPQ